MKIVIIHDSKTGHTHQSKAVAEILRNLLRQKNVDVSICYAPVEYKSNRHYKILAVLSVFSFLFSGKKDLNFLRFFLTEESIKALNVSNIGFVISTGSSLAVINYALKCVSDAKNIVILKPGLLSYQKFDLVVLPEHDKPRPVPQKPLFAFTYAAPNLINKDYLKKQTDELLTHFSHLKTSMRMKIGLFIGGDTKTVFISEQQIRILVNQLKEVLTSLKAEILITTSRRTSARVEHILLKEFRKNPSCLLFVQPNKENIPEAVGGIMGLSDLLIVSGDSISMVSEAVSSGKKTIVFSPECRNGSLPGKNKYHKFVETLSRHGFILSTDTKNIGQSIYNIAKNKIQTRQLADNDVLSTALQKIL